MRNPRRFLFASLFAVTATLAFAGDLDRQLYDQYASKMLVLRGFYSGDKLRYDSSGSLVSGNPSGDWTSDGFVLISDIGVNGHELRIKAQRMPAFFENKTFSLRVAESQVARPGENKTITVQIAADLGGRHPSADQARTALLKIFLSDKDDFVSLIPEYWKPCVPAGLAGNDANCHFAPEILSVPGVRAPDHDASAAIAGTEDNGAGVGQPFRVGKGVSPPRRTSGKEPEFSELARRMKYQGVGTLGLVVSQDGVPTKVHVLTPLGCGLDAQAVRAVEAWRFTPAEKDGQPVSVEIAVEVSFHLY